MADQAFSPSTVRLFGRVVEGVDPKDNLLSKSSVNKRLRQQIEESKKGPGAGLRFALIYAFTFEGSFHNLPKPTIFLVDGVGEEPAGNLGMAATEVQLDKGIRCWVCDKDDISLRADVITGTLEDILIDATLLPTSKYPITPRGQEASWRDGQMIARNRLRD